MIKRDEETVHGRGSTKDYDELIQAKYGLCFAGYSVLGPVHWYELVLHLSCFKCCPMYFTLVNSLLDLIVHNAPTSCLADGGEEGPFMIMNADYK